MNQPTGAPSSVAAEPALEAVEVEPERLAALAQDFHEHGYVIIRDALPAARVATLLEAIEESRSLLEGHPHRSPTASGLNIRPIIDKHPAFRDLLICPTTFAAVAKLLDHYSIALQQSNLIEAPPSRERRQTGWHSDGGIPTIAVNGVRAFGSLKVGYFLTDHRTPDSGALMLVPGSHRLQGPPPFPVPGGDPTGATQLGLGAGDAVIFQQGVWHAAAPNLSQRPRVALYYGYSYRLLRPVDYQRMPAEMLDASTPVERQLLGETVTHQGFYVPTDDDVPLRGWYERHFGAVEDRGQLDRVGQVTITGQPVP